MIRQLDLAVVLTLYGASIALGQSLEDKQALARNADKNLVNPIIQAAKKQDEATVNSLISQIESQAKPPAGDPAEATALNKIGLTQLMNKNYAEAANLFAQAAQKDPSDPKLWSNLGFAQTNMGDLGGGTKNLCHSLILAPRRSVAWSDLGVSFAKDNNPDNAVACFLLGYRLSNGKTLGFLQSLTDSKEEDLRLTQAAKIAISHIESLNQRGTAPVAPATVDAASTVTQQEQSRRTQDLASSESDLQNPKVLNVPIPPKGALVAASTPPPVRVAKPIQITAPATFAAVPKNAIDMSESQLCEILKYSHIPFQIVNAKPPVDQPNERQIEIIENGRSIIFKTACGFGSIQACYAVETIGYGNYLKFVDCMGQVLGKADYQCPNISTWGNCANDYTMVFNEGFKDGKAAVRISTTKNDIANSLIDDSIKINPN